MSHLDKLAPSRRSLLLGAAAAAPLVALGGASAHAAVGGLKNAGGLTITHHWNHPEIRSIDYRFDTHGMVKLFPPSIRVTVPPSYFENKDRRYPVLLLLHGQGGYYLDWTKMGGVIEQTEKHEVIVVMPDGGGSFYSNANQPLPNREANWESFIMTQVLPFVHENFRTDPKRMAIAGLSMGGWGALALGQRYWGHFRSVSSYSGPGDRRPETGDGAGVHLAIWISPGLEVFKRGPHVNPPGSTWGHAVNPPIAKTYNPIENLDKYRGKRLFLRTGDGGWDDFFGDLAQSPDLAAQFAEKANSLGVDVIEGFVHPNLERFHKAAVDAGLDSDFKLFPGRTHDWGLWKENLAEDLPGMMKVLNA